MASSNDDVTVRLDMLCNQVAALMSQVAILSAQLARANAPMSVSGSLASSTVPAPPTQVFTAG